MRRRIPFAIILVLIATLLARRLPSRSSRSGGRAAYRRAEAPGLDQHLSISFLTHSS